jgi:hypothetical protein
VKRDVSMGFGLLDHRGLRVVDLEYVGYREFKNSGLAHIQTSADM